jgi:magnesium transporter
MAKALRKRKPIGLPPGTPVHAGVERSGKVTVGVIDYDVRDIEERVEVPVADCTPYRDRETVTWVNVDGVHDVELVQGLGGVFGLHPLVVEDIVDTNQRPKLEDYGDYLYVVVKMLSYGNDSGEVEAEQVSLILGKSFVISFQERPGDVFDPVRERLRSAKGRIRTMHADYLLYSLLDAIVDHYFVICERLGDRIETLQDELIDNPVPQKLSELHHLKRQTLGLRRSVWPLREVMAAFNRGEAPQVSKQTTTYLRDLYDHTIQASETLETVRDTLASLFDIYLSAVSNRMNEVMKVLTIIATIFIPLGFIAGLYGMNFAHMPELQWRYAYPVALSVMWSVAAGMLLYFRRKGWL